MSKTYTDAEVLEIVQKIRALQDLTKTTGTITTRAQSGILRVLPDDVLTRVSVALSKEASRG
jgi:hypothetical protein